MEEKVSGAKSEKSGRKTNLQTVEQISAGGVAFRRNENETQAALIKVNPNERWQLPKGLVDKGETPKAAAQREVREEAGIETVLIEKIETIEYWYVGNSKGERVRFHKFVHFYLLEYKSGNVKDHDAEVLEARWVEIDEAARKLTFRSEKETLEKAKNLIKQLENAQKS